MKHVKKIVSRFGFIDIFSNEKESFLYIIPHGYVGPSLVKSDLEYALSFDKNCKGQWSYIVDTSKVLFPNPFNVFYLGGIRKFKKMDQYVVYAPSRVVRIVMKLSSFISKPDKVVSDHRSLHELLD